MATWQSIRSGIPRAAARALHENHRCGRAGGDGFEGGGPVTRADPRGCPALGRGSRSRAHSNRRRRNLQLSAGPGHRGRHRASAPACSDRRHRRGIPDEAHDEHERARRIRTAGSARRALHPLRESKRLPRRGSTAGGTRASLAHRSISATPRRADRIDFAVPRASIDQRPHHRRDRRTGRGCHRLRHATGVLPGPARLAPISSAIRTDDTGQYRVVGLQPGDYFVVAMLRETWITGGEKKQVLGYAPTFFPWHAIGNRCHARQARGGQGCTQHRHRPRPDDRRDHFRRRRPRRWRADPRSERLARAKRRRPDVAVVQQHRQRARRARWRVAFRDVAPGEYDAERVVDDGRTACASPPR